MPLKNRNTIISLAVSLFLICFIGWVYSAYFLQPLKHEIDESRQNKERLQSRLQTAKQRAQQLSKIQEEMAGLNVEVAALERQLPKGKELPALIRTFTHRAEAFGVQVNTFSPGQLSAKGLFDEVPYMVSVTTSFHGLGRFLTAMGKGERLFAARNLAVNGATGGKDSSKTINATFSLVAFKYHE